jgi:hypothetical protein
MNDEINAYCSKQNDSFKSWYQDNLKKYKHVDLLHQLKDKLVFKNGNSFIHELIARNNIDWLYALGPEKINEHVKNKNKKTVLQALKEKLAYPDHHQLMIMRLIQFFENRNQLL